MVAVWDAPCQVTTELAEHHGAGSAGMPSVGPSAVGPGAARPGGQPGYRYSAVVRGREREALRAVECESCRWAAARMGEQLRRHGAGRLLRAQGGPVRIEARNPLLPTPIPAQGVLCGAGVLGHGAAAHLRSCGAACRGRTTAGAGCAGGGGRRGRRRLGRRSLGAAASGGRAPSLHARAARDANGAPRALCFALSALIYCSVLLTALCLRAPPAAVAFRASGTSALRMTATSPRLRSNVGGGQQRPRARRLRIYRGRLRSAVAGVCMPQGGRALHTSDVQA